MVEPIPTRNPRVYFARVVSDVFVRAGHDICRLSDVHRSSLNESKAKKEPSRVDSENQKESEVKGGNQGVSEEKWDVRAVVTPGSLGDRGNIKVREPCYCMMEVINTSVSSGNRKKCKNRERGIPRASRR